MLGGAGRAPGVEGARRGQPFVATIVPASSVFQADSLICQSLGGRGQEIQSYAVISRSAA